MEIDGQQVAGQEGVGVVWVVDVRVGCAAAGAGFFCWENGVWLGGWVGGRRGAGEGGRVADRTVGVEVGEDLLAEGGGSAG